MDQHQVKEGGTMDRHKEEEEQQEGDPTDRRREEEVAGKPDEPTDQRKEEEEEEEEEEREEGDNLKEPTGQRKEEEKEDKSGELTDQRKADAVAEELTDQHRVEVEEGEKETERSSGEESMAASSFSLFVHPCSLLLRYLFRAYAWCLGMADSFGGGTRPSAAPAASTNSSREEPGEAADIGTREISKTTTDRGFYMREVIMRVRAVRRPRPPGNPREGRGGGGGSHN